MDEDQAQTVLRVSDTMAVETKTEPKVLELPADDVPVARYAPLELLGEGGMGEVRLCDDRRIGRRVAMKTMRPEHATHGRLRARFVREARVQGRLEHPAIVPVYDLGNGFFTMKRVRGITLDALLDRLRVADRSAIHAHSPHRLLAAFAQVCLAVDYAHSRGVVHRDLKPANLMLGDFGEVYVLDWGLAKVVADPEDDADVLDLAVPATSERTAAGAVLGTPAYAPPEQLAGSEVDARTDVWALGAILFELLTTEPLNQAPTVAALIAKTLANELDARTSVRAPDRAVPPELEAICVRATAFEPSERFPSARALHEAVEQYLSGDRDRDARIKLARAHEVAARKAAAEAFSGSTEARGRALAEVGRALALDPESQAAAGLLYDLVDRTPTTTPPEVGAELDRLAEENLRSLMPAGALIHSAPALFLFLPLALWMGMKLPWLIAACVVPYFAGGALMYLAYRRNRLGASLRYLLPITALSVACASVLLGPFFFVPALATICAAVFCAIDPRLNRLYVIALFVLAVVVPAVLGPATHDFLPDGSLRIASHALSLPRTPTLTLFVVSSLFTIAGGGLLLGRSAVKLRAAEARRLTQRWQLAQLLPQRVLSNLRSSR